MSDWTYDRKAWDTGNGWGYDEGGLGDEARIETKVLAATDILHDPVINLVRERAGDYYYSLEPLYLVTEGKWSGYSEFTITSQWDEVHVHYGDVDLHWNSMGEFISALAEANPAKDLS